MLSSATARVFTSNKQISAYVSGTYNIYECVEYAGAIWRANTTTSATPAEPDWDILYTNVRDGDIAIIVAGSIDFQQRISGQWLSMGFRPKTAILADNQVALTEIFNYAANDFKKVRIEYEVSRPSGRSRSGFFSVLSDGVSEMSYDEEFILVGADVGVTITPSISAGVISLSYTSENQGTPITFKYNLKGW